MIDQQADREVSVGSVSDATIEVAIGGVEYGLKRLTLQDLADTEEYIRSRRIKVARHALGASSTELDASTVCEIVSRGLSLADILSEFDGECMILARGLLRNGQPVGLPYVMREMRQEDRNVVRSVLLYLAGLRDHPFDEPASDRSGPKTTGDSTSNRSAANAGTDGLRTSRPPMGTRPVSSTA